MRSALFILIGSALLAVGLPAASGLSVADLQQQLTAGGKTTVIDIRNPLAYMQEHIPGAINIPAILCPRKNLPRLGSVAVYGDGLGNDAAETAAATALAQKPGINVEVLEGGFAAWKSSQGMTTRGPGFKREALNYITYAHLKTANADGLILVDLRKPAPAGAQAMTDLNVEFPGRRQAKSASEKAKSGSGAPPLLVLIDSGDGSAEAQARLLKAGGMHRYVILAGGEMILSRHGQGGLQRGAPGTGLSSQIPNPPGAVK